MRSDHVYIGGQCAAPKTSNHETYQNMYKKSL